MNSPRVEMPEPEWIRDPRAWPGPVILPEHLRETLAPRRLLLSARALAQQLRCHKSIVNAWLKVRGLHEASEGEKKAEAGLCAEDLAALSLTGLLIRKYRCPLNSAAECFRELLQELLESCNPARTMLVVITGNKGSEFQVTTSAIPGNFLMPTPGMEAHVHAYEASQLRNRIDEAMVQAPLKLPSAESSRVQA